MSEGIALKYSPDFKIELSELLKVVPDAVPFEYYELSSAFDVNTSQWVNIRLLCVPDNYKGN